jgi:signal transduction histidine kinase
VELITKTDRACVVAAAAAHEFNNELTVILSTVASSLEALEPGHPARLHLVTLQDAAERCARNTSGLLHFSKRRDAPVVRTSFEKLLANQ